MAKTPTNAVTWRVDDSQWKAGLAAIPTVFGGVADRHLNALVDEGFEKSQANVHVESGALRETGRVERTERGMEITYEVIYGGTSDVEYAGYEELLHPYLEPAMVEAMNKYESQTDVMGAVGLVGGVL